MKFHLYYFNIISLLTDSQVYCKFHPANFSIHMYPTELNSQYQVFIQHKINNSFLLFFFFSLKFSSPLLQTSSLSHFIHWKARLLHQAISSLLFSLFHVFPPVISLIPEYIASRNTNKTL